ncbi:MAG: hypothetical protein ACM3SY_05145 [Candidatus Omnitrophota bacterium]
MSIKKYAVLLIGVLVLLSCSRVNTIPEISPSVYDEDILDLSSKPVVKKLIKSNAGLIFITQDGEIFRWNFASKMKDSLYTLNHPVQADSFVQNNYLVLKQLPSTYFVFDLDQMKIRTVLKDLNIDRISGIDEKCLVYVSGGDKPTLTVLNYQNNKRLTVVPLDPNESIFNSDWKANKLFILTTLRCYMYDKTKNTVEFVPLNDKAASNFLLDQDVIYYGSEKRELIQLSLNTFTTQWRFKLAEPIRTTPRKIGPYVVAVPRDNNIYFFNKNGTLYWWSPLGSTIEMPPEPMNENAAVCLWDGSIKFFNYKTKTAITYPVKSDFRSNPVFINGYLYIVTENEMSNDTEKKAEPFRWLTRIGNYYGVEVKTTPEYAKVPGKSIRFALTAVNLIKPSFDVKIINNRSPNQEPVFQKTIGEKDKPELIWVPSTESEYMIKVLIHAQNKDNLTVEQTFNVIDYNRMMREYFYKVQSQCDFGSIN